MAERLAHSADPAGIVPRPVNRVLVIGAGTIWSGIAVSLADAAIMVDLLEQDAGAAMAGSERVASLYAARVKRGHLSEEAPAECQAHILVGRDWTAVSEVDLLIEAAFEDTAQKSAPAP